MSYHYNFNAYMLTRRHVYIILIRNFLKNWLLYYRSPKDGAVIADKQS